MLINGKTASIPGKDPSNSSSAPTPPVVVGRLRVHIATARLFTAVLLLIGALLLSPAPLAAQPPAFGEQADLGLLQSAEIGEASGIVASRRTSGVLWTHNDSGDKNRIFAINEKGALLATCVPLAISARDWEDITIGPGPVPGEIYLYVADIGDNSARYGDYYIYRFPEPAVDPAGRDRLLIAENVDKIIYHYPDGARDAETLMSDPLTGDLYVVSKRDSANRLYRLPFPQPVGENITAEYIATLPLTSAVAGDIASSGREILLKNYFQVFWWTRSEGQSVGEAMQHSYELLPYVVEPQGEAICWRLDGGGYYTLSEKRSGISPHLYYYPRLSTSVAGGDTIQPPILSFQPALPNPFNSSTEFGFTIAHSTYVSMAVFNEIGQQVALLLDEPLAAGSHRIHWRADSLGSGFYLCRLQAGGQVRTQKVQLIR